MQPNRIFLIRPGYRIAEGTQVTENDEKAVTDLRSELWEKERMLTDIRLEALNSAHHLGQLQEAMNNMQVRVPQWCLHVVDTTNYAVCYSHAVDLTLHVVDVTHSAVDVSPTMQFTLHATQLTLCPTQLKLHPTKLNLPPTKLTLPPQSWSYTSTQLMLHLIHLTFHY